MAADALNILGAFAVGGPVGAGAMATAIAKRSATKGVQKAAGQTAKEQVKAALKQGASQLHKRGVRANPADRTVDGYVRDFIKKKGGNPVVTRKKAGDTKPADIARHRIDGHGKTGANVTRSRRNELPNGEVRYGDKGSPAVSTTKNEVKKLYKGDT